ncbi:hypothetical protein EDD86DRAFT_271171, partial [Gorgonomyces haynaldii]
MCMMLFTEPLQKQSILTKRDFQYTKPTGYLAFWVPWAQSLRALMHSSLPALPNIQNLDPVGLATGYYFRFVIAVALLIVSLIITFLVNVILCCCACCAKGRDLRRLKRPPPSTLKRIWSGFLFLLLVVVSGLAVTGYSFGTLGFGDFIDGMQTSTTSLVTDTKALVRVVVPTVSNVVTAMKATVSDVIDTAVNSVQFSVLTNVVYPPMTQMAYGLRNTQGNMSLLLVLGDSLTVSVNALVSNSTSLQTVLSSISSGVGGLSTPSFAVPGYAGTTWYLTNAVPFSLSASDIKNAAMTAPNVSQIFSPIRTSPNLSTYADTIFSTQASAITTAQSNIANATTGFKNSAFPALDSVKTGISNTFSSTETSITKMLDDLQTTANSYLNASRDYTTMTALYRVLAVALFGLPIVVAFLGIGVRKPKLVKACNCLCIPYYMLLHILAIIFLIMSFVIGDVCNVVFDQRPLVIQGLDASTLGSVNLAVSVLDNCYSNASLIDIASSAGLVDSSAVNFTKLAKDQLDSLNFSSVSSFDVSAVLDLNSSPTSQLSNLNNVNLSSIDSSSLDSIVNVRVPTLKANLTTLYNSLSAFMSISSGNALTVLTVNPNSNSAANDAALTDFKSKVQVILNQITSLTGSGGTLDQISWSAGNLSLSMVTVNNTATTVINTANTLPGLYNQSIALLTQFAVNASANITNSIPTIKTMILNSVANQQTYINTQMQCRQVAVDMYGMRDALCGKLMISLDAQWLGLSVLAIWTLIGIPTMIVTANVFALKRPPKGDAEFDETEEKDEKKDKLNELVKDGKAPGINIPDIQQTEEISPLDQVMPLHSRTSSARPHVPILDQRVSALSMPPVTPDRQPSNKGFQELMNGTIESVDENLDVYIPDENGSMKPKRTISNQPPQQFEVQVDGQQEDPASKIANMFADMMAVKNSISRQQESEIHMEEMPEDDVSN